MGLKPPPRPSSPPPGPGGRPLSPTPAPGGPPSGQPPYPPPPYPPPGYGGYPGYPPPAPPAPPPAKKVGPLTIVLLALVAIVGYKAATGGLTPPDMSGGGPGGKGPRGEGPPGMGMGGDVPVMPTMPQGASMPPGMGGGPGMGGMPGGMGAMPGMPGGDRKRGLAMIEGGDGVLGAQGSHGSHAAAVPPPPPPAPAAVAAPPAPPPPPPVVKKTTTQVCREALEDIWQAAQKYEAKTGAPPVRGRGESADDVVARLAREGVLAWRTAPEMASRPCPGGLKLGSAFKSYAGFEPLPAGKAPAAVPFVWDLTQAQHPDVGRNVLFRDGSVRFMKEEDFQRLLSAAR